MGSLEGRTWRLVGCAQADGGMAAVSPEVEATARFEAGRVYGTSGCNRYTGSYSRSGDRLTLGPLAGTMMACPDEQMAVEEAFHRAAARVAGLADGDERLELLADDGSPVLVFVPAPVTPLVGTRWSATGINNGRGGVVSLVAGTEVDASFGADGRLAGFAGCNEYTAGYEVMGDSIAIGPVAAGGRRCPDPPGSTDQEAAFLAALARATRVMVEGDQLELRDADGALQAGFSAAR